MPVPLLQQHLHRLHRGLKVIGGHAGKVRVVQSLRRGGHQHRRQRDALKAPLKVIGIPAQKQDAQRLFLGAQRHRPQHLVGVLVKIVHQQRVARLVEKPLQLLHQCGKQLIPCALYQHQDAAVHRLLEVFGVGILDIAVSLHYLHNAPPGLFAHVGVVIQHAGDGSHRIAAFFCNILDRHGILTPLRHRQPHP